MAQGSTVSSSVPQDPPADDDTDLAGADGAQDGAEAATEARAREMGWKPLAEYRGPPGKWQPAADFIERGENILPIVRDQNRRLTERVGKLEGEISGLRNTADEQLKIIKDLRDMGSRADQRGYDRAMADINAKKQQARAAGDVESFAQLVEQAEALAESRPAAAAVAEPAPKPAAPPQVTVSEATRSFVASNPWFNRDQALNNAMIAHHIEVIKEGQIVDEAEQLEEAKQRVMDAYPDRFSNPPAREPNPPPRLPARASRRAAVAAPTPGNEPAPRPGAALTTINQIQDPAERAQAREAFTRTKRQLPDYTEKEYMELYADPHGDVLTLQQQKLRSQADGR